MPASHHIALRWLEAFNAHNLEDLLGLYDDAAIHHSPKLKSSRPETEGLIQGKPALRSWWKEALDRLPSLQYDPRTLTADESRVFMEYTRKVDGEEDMAVAEVLEIKNGLIIASRVYHG